LASVAAIGEHGNGDACASGFDSFPVSQTLEKLAGERTIAVRGIEQPKHTIKRAILQYENNDMFNGRKLIARHVV
jgi:hypothetical protein